MISRILLTTPRFSLAGTTRFLQSSTRNYGSLRENGEKGMKIAKTMLSGAGKPLRVVKKWLPSRVPSPTFGQIVFAGFATLELGCLVYNGVVSNKSKLSQWSKKWSDTVWWNIIRTYAYLFASLALTAATTFSLSHFPRFMTSSMAFVGSAVTAAVSWFLCNRIPYEETLSKHTAWIVHCASWGIYHHSISSLYIGTRALSVVGIVRVLAVIIAGSFIVATTISPLILQEKFHPVFNVDSWLLFIALGAGSYLLPLSMRSRFHYALIAYALVVLSSLGAQFMCISSVYHKKLQKKEKDGKELCFDPIKVQLSIYVSVMGVLSLLRLFNKFT